MHPPAELLAAFAEGNLERQRIPEVLAHLEHCQTCMTALELADEEIATTATATATGPQPRRTWLLLAAAAVLAGVAVTALLVVRPWQSPIDRLIAASPRSARVVEPRLAGGFPWVAYRGPLRASDPSADPAHLRLLGAAAGAVERGNRDASSAAQHAAGVALVLVDDAQAAIPHLRAATERAPNDAQVWSDLSAAEYAAALRSSRPALYADALEHAGHALRLDPRLPEALFNRALALERMGRTDLARAAWSRYLAVDSTSQWAAEARDHVAHLVLPQ